MSWKVASRFPAAALILAPLMAGLAFGQARLSDKATGREIFLATCISCHGAEARGAPDATRGFEPPKSFPNFSVCNATTREPNRDWRAIIMNGGPARGFSQIMPSFRDLLTADQITKVIEFLRGVCGEPKWPRGEMNLPRAMVTEKAFPEDEVAIDASFDTKGPANITNRMVYEKRFGARNQIDIVVPFNYHVADSGNWFGGIGDMSFGLKRVIASSLKTGSIFSVAGEVIAPSGNVQRGTGTGVTVFETFGSYGQVLPKDSFLQFQAGIELPTNTEKLNRAAYWRTVLGKTFIASKGHGRLWSPMVEVLADRELVSGAPVNWDLLPQIQVTLSRRQHIRADFGVRIPANNTANRSPAIMFYLLWDYFDGGLRDGW